MARLLVIAAHPDDEGFAGGYIAKQAATGDEVIILCTTRGEGGEIGDAPLQSKEELGRWREEEMRQAGAALGAKEVRFLDFTDPNMEIDGFALPIDATLEEFTAALVTQIADLRPDAILTHGSDGEYGHPQHVFTHRAVWAALADLAPWQPRELLTWCADFPAAKDRRLLNESDPATEVVDISPWLEAKIGALEAHRSQHQMFIRNSGKSSIREFVRPIESLRSWPPDDPIRAAAEWAKTGRPPKPSPKDMSRSATDPTASESPN